MNNKKQLSHEPTNELLAIRNTQPNATSKCMSNLIQWLHQQVSVYSSLLCQVQQLSLLLRVKNSIKYFIKYYTKSYDVFNFLRKICHSLFLSLEHEQTLSLRPLEDNIRRKAFGKYVTYSLRSKMLEFHICCGTLWTICVTLSINIPEC